MRADFAARVTQLTLPRAFPVEHPTMGTHFGTRPGPLSSASRSPLSALAFFVAWLLVGAAQPIAALDRDVTLELLPPDSGGVDGYNIYARDEGTGALLAFDTGRLDADGDGIARTIFALPAENAYRVTMTSYGPGGESVGSNALLVPAEAACDVESCDDLDPCTLDSCDAQSCIYEPAPDGTLCDDGFADTVEDACRAGVCEGLLLVCQDDLDCDDGDVCNGAELCDGGRVCLEGEPLDCGEPSQCQVPSCDPELGCQIEDRPDDTACDDGDANTRDDACHAGICAGQPIPDEPGDPGGELPGLTLDQVGPTELTPGRHSLGLFGQGFQVGTRLSFENGRGKPPVVRQLRLNHETWMEAMIEVPRRVRKRGSHWDVVVTLPDGTSARLPQGLMLKR
jgi:hypothetical protein